VITEDDKQPDLTEAIKLGFETFKQLTTLSAGSIVVIGTFLSNIFPTDSQGTLTVPLYIKLLLGAAFLGFGATLICSTFAMFQSRLTLLLHLETGDPNAGFEDEKAVFLTLVLSVTLFSGGIICFGTAVLLNLFFGS